MIDDTATAIIRAAAALVKPNASPIIENLELVQDMAESAAAYLQSHDAPAVTDKLPGDLHAWLIDEVGMQPELAGGGCVMLRHFGANGAYVLVTGSDGAHLPSWGDWCVGAYPPAADCAEEAMLVLYSTERPSPLARPLTLRQAVGAACSVVAEYEPAAPAATAAPAPAFIATHLDDSHEAAILAALRLLVSDMRSQAGPAVGIINILDGCGDFPALEADAIEAFADALANDTWLCQTATPRADAAK